MAKVIIELDLDKDKDLRDYNLFNNASSMYNALFEISYNLKNKVKYTFDGDDNGAFDSAFENIAKIIKENNVFWSCWNEINYYICKTKSAKIRNIRFLSLHLAVIEGNF